MTGEAWQELMFDLYAQRSINYECKEGATYNDFVDAGNVAVGCGSAVTSRIFFITYIFVVFIVLVNLFIAVTLQGFE